MPVLGTLTPSTGTLTFTGVATDTQTVVIDGKTYTTQTTLTDSDGNVLIGADQTATCANLAAAINLGAGSGTTYAASTTRHPSVVATSAAAVLTATARLAGTLGDNIPTTETQTNASWGAATMASGAGSTADALNTIIDEAQVNSDVIAAIRSIMGTAFIERA